MNRLCKVGDIISHKRLKRISKRDGAIPIQEITNRDNVANGWLVVETKMTGGGTGHGPHDVYPDGHEVTVRFMYSNGPSEKDFPIKFYQTGSFTGDCMIKKEEIELVEEVDILPAEISVKRRVVV